LFARKRTVVFRKAGLRAGFRKIERPMVQYGCAEIRSQITTVAPYGAIVHQAVLEKHLLPGTNVIAGENNIIRCIDRSFGNGWRIPIGLEG